MTALDATTTEGGPVTALDPAPTPTFEERARRIDAAQRAVARLEDAAARDAAGELGAALEALQAAVLTTVVRRLRADERGRELLYELVDDAEVHGALVRAGIVKPSPAMRAVQVLDGLRPYITSHGGDVELVRIDQGVAYVRLLGACQGCGSSTQTLRDLVAETLLEHLPELDEVQEAPPDAPAAAEAFIPVTALRRKAAGPA